jgi:streptogramin lyase
MASFRVFPRRLIPLIAAAAECCLLAHSPVSLAQPLITEFPLPGTGEITLGFLYAHSMTTGPDGNIWFTHYSRSTIVRMAVDGTVTELLLPPKAHPSGLVVGPDQNIWYLTTRDPQGVDRMTTSGQITHFPVTTASLLCGLVGGADGNVWFTEASGATEAIGPYPTAVGRISPSGTISLYGLPAGYSGTGIIRSSEGDLWFIFARVFKLGFAAGIERITLDGTMSVVVDEAGLAGTPPISLTLGPDGNVWFTAYDTIGKVTPAGVMTKYRILILNGYPFDITAGPDGNLWFTEYDGNKIGRITPQGVMTEFPVPTPHSGPTAICVGPDGNIWFTESKANKVGRLALSGPASGKATLTIPTAASKTGLNGTFFHTDVWLMNRSYTSSTPVTLVYRCSGGQSCGNGSQVLSIAPRQEVMLTDIIGQTLGAPGTSGAIEISWPTSAGPVSASSRVSSPLPPATAFGTMIPALPQTAARTRALFLGLSWGGSLNSGSRSNAGAYNPNETPVDVTFTLRDGDGTILGAVTRTWAPQESFQLSPNIFDLLGVGSAVTSNAYLVVTATAAVFPYVTVVDNVSGDSSFLPASDDESEP